MKNKAFTLVEILVVVGVLLILVAIIFPLMASSKDRAREATESARLRQIYVALTLYEQEHDDKVASSLLKLAPRYFKESYLAFPGEHREGNPSQSYPAHPWVNIVGIDPAEIIEERTSGIVSYAYLKSYEARFAQGRTYDQYRQEPPAGVLAGFGLLKCAGCNSGDQLCIGSCLYRNRANGIDVGHPATNLQGKVMIAQMDGSIRWKQMQACGGSTSYGHIHLFFRAPMTCTRNSISGE